MFMAQMTNQDPLNPMDSSNFAAQLAQFSSLEQLTQINQNLSGLADLPSELAQTQALSYLGQGGHGQRQLHSAEQRRGQHHQLHPGRRRRRQGHCQRLQRPGRLQR